MQRAGRADDAPLTAVPVGPPDLAPVMTIGQVAAQLGIPEAELLSVGPRTLNVLGTVMVLRDDLRAWLASR